MKSIVVTYPDYQSLPKGIKRMLVISESFFFTAINPSFDGSRKKQVYTSPSVRAEAIDPVLRPNLVVMPWRNAFPGRVGAGV